MDDDVHLHLPKTTFAKVIPGPKTLVQLSAGIPYYKNISSCYSPVSDVSSLDELWLPPASKLLLMDESMDLRTYHQSIKSDSSDQYFPVAPEVVIANLDWDEKLAAMGYGHDVFTVVHALAKTVSRTYDGDDRRGKRSTVNFTLSVPQGMAAPKLPSTANQKLDESSETISKVSVNKGKAEMSEQSIISMILDKGIQEYLEEDKSQSKLNHPRLTVQLEEDSLYDDYIVQDNVNLNLDKDEVIEVMRRATQDERISDNILELIMEVKGFKSKECKQIGWDKVKKNRHSSVHLTRELGRLELKSCMLVREITLLVCCHKNKDGTKDLILHGKDLQQRMGRRLCDVDIPILLYFLEMNHDVVYIDLSYNQITTIGLRLITTYLSTNDKIVGINLMCNDIKDITSHDVVDLNENKKLKSLRLNGNFIKRKGGEFVSFVIMFKALEHIDLSETDQNIQAIPWIIQAVAQSKTLKALDVSRVLGQPFYGEHTKHLATLFGDLVKFSTTLVELHLQKNGLSDHDMVQLMEGFLKNKVLEVLDLSCNRIGDYGAEIIANHLQCGAPLKALMLSSNHIGDAGARSLSFKLPYSQIKLLDVARNRIKDRGIRDLMYTIIKPYPMMALYIFGNRFGEETASVILKEINTGNLMAESLDVKVASIGRQVQHGYNPFADRYRTNYYRISPYGFLQIFSLKRRVKQECTAPGECLNYMYHNIVNPRKNLQMTIPPPEFSPFETITGTCLS